MPQGDKSRGHNSQRPKPFGAWQELGGDPRLSCMVGCDPYALSSSALDSAQHGLCCGALTHLGFC